MLLAFLQGDINISRSVVADDATALRLESAGRVDFITVALRIIHDFAAALDGRRIFNSPGDYASFATVTKSHSPLFI